MLGHIGVSVPDLATAKAYYSGVLSLLEFELYLDDADQCAYRPTGGRRGTYLFLYPETDPATEPTGPYSRHRSGLQHLAFMARTRGDVDGVHRHVVAAGAEVLHPPQVFPQYPQPYYATFWLDPFGVMLEAVCHHDRD